MSREERAVLAAWERVQKQERTGSAKQRRQDLRASRTTKVCPPSSSSPSLPPARGGPGGASQQTGRGGGGVGPACAIMWTFDEG